MEKLYTNIIGTPVYEDDEARPFTTVKDLVMDTETGKLLALVINVNKNLIITSADISSWGDVIRIQNRDSVIEGSEVLRVEEVQKNGIIIFHNKVETPDEEVIGKVFDFSINVNTLDLQKIFGAKGLLGLFRYDHRIISVKNIIEILPDKIIVKNNLKTVKEERKREVSVEDMAMS